MLEVIDRMDLPSRMSKLQRAPAGRFVLEGFLCQKKAFGHSRRKVQLVAQYDFSALFSAYECENR